MPDVPTKRLASLYRRPGFLLRRANQIAADHFLEAMAPLDITTTQYGTLVVLSERAPIDQIGVARALGLDRSTAGLLVANLERRGLIARTADHTDRRRRMLTITEAGATLLEEAHGRSLPVPLRTLAPLDAAEQEVLLDLLSRLVDAFNAGTRAPIRE